MYQAHYRRLRRPGLWGTYFHRLIDFEGNGVTNPLETAIQKLRSWPKRAQTGMLFHLSAPTLDSLRPRNGPCLQYIQILWGPDGTLDLAAVYRNHDYSCKALGNFIGLGQLLRFICNEANKVPGNLVVHSMHAYLTLGVSRTKTLSRIP